VSGSVEFRPLSERDVEICALSSEIIEMCPGGLRPTGGGAAMPHRFFLIVLIALSFTHTLGQVRASPESAVDVVISLVLI
jgi:hypothetical protein